MSGIWSATWQNKAVINSLVVVIDSSVPGRVAHLLPAWRKYVTMTIGPTSTIVLIGLQETNTIGYYWPACPSLPRRSPCRQCLQTAQTSHVTLLTTSTNLSKAPPA